MTSPSTHKLGLADLPVELLGQICSLLCLHCQCRHVALQPTANVVAWYEGQKDLARLSRTCRPLRNVAQQFLFHWYHAVDRLDEASEFRRFASFLLATLHSRHLAKAVKSLVLDSPVDDLGVPMSEEMRAVRVRLKSDSTYCRVIQGLGSYLGNGHVLDTIMLQDIALAYLPGVSEVSLRREFYHISGSKLQKTNVLASQLNQWSTRWKYPLPALRYFVFRGQESLRLPELAQAADSGHHITNLQNLLRCAPNLETLIVSDGSGNPIQARPSFQVLRPKPWKVWLLRLRRLSINGIGVQELACLVASCPELEDVEYFDSAKPPRWFRDRRHTPWSKPWALDPAEHLGSALTTLKRICYSVMNLDEHTYKIPTSYVKGVMPALVYPPENLGGGLSFAKFPALERLEVEQLTLYGLFLFRGPDDLILERTTSVEMLERLPPNLVRLRVGRVDFWPVMMRDMVALSSNTARGGGMFCPHLEMVHLEVGRVPPQSEYRFLVEVMAERGVHFSLSHPSYSCENRTPRGMLPPRPGACGEFARPVQFGESTSYPRN